MRSDAARERLRFDDGAGNALDLVFDAASPAAELDAAEPAARAGGVVRSEQLCHVHGTARIAGEARELRCLGQRGLTHGSRTGSGSSPRARSRRGWTTGPASCSARSARPASAAHGCEETWAAVLGAAGALRVDEPRLSTTYDEEGRQWRAGLELWIGEDDELAAARGRRGRCAAPRSTSAPCGWTARSCAGGWRAAAASAATTCCAAHDRGGGLGLRRRADLAAPARVQPRAGRHRRAGRGLGDRDGRRPGARRRAPAVRARARRDHRGRVPGAARARARGRARPQRAAARLRRAADGGAGPQPRAVRPLRRAQARARPALRPVHQQRARVGAAVAGQAADRRRLRGRRRLRVRRDAQARAGDLRAHARAARAARRSRARSSTTSSTTFKRRARRACAASCTATPGRRSPSSRRCCEPFPDASA